MQQPMKTRPQAQRRHLFLVKIGHPRGTIYEVRQYPSSVDAVIDALLRYDNGWPVVVRPLGGAL